MKTIFTQGRRRYLTKICENSILIIIGAAFASKFFIEFSIKVKIAVIGFVLVLFLAGFFITPEEKGGD